MRKLSSLGRSRSHVGNILEGNSTTTSDFACLYVWIGDADIQISSNANGKLFCEVSVGKNVLQTTKSKAKNRPKFRSAFLFNRMPNDVLMVRLYIEEDTKSTRKNTLFLKKDKNVTLFGEVLINLTSIDTTLKDDWFSLYQENSRESSGPVGSIHIQIMYVDPNVKGRYQERMKETNWHNLSELLLSPGYPAVSSLMDHIDMAETDKIAPTLVRFFEYNSKVTELLRLSITKEVQQTTGPQLLFRANSISSKLVSVYAKLSGVHYLKSVLSPFLSQIASSKANNYEVDPSKVKGNVDLKENAQRLEGLCQQCLDLVLGSVKNCPTNIKMICNLFQTIVATRFEEFAVKAVGSFFVLRFVSPAIVAPESFGIVSEPPNAEVRRVLVLIAKVFQNLANGIEFGAKEPFMTAFNPFIMRNQLTTFQFFKELAGTIVSKVDQLLISDEDVFFDLVNMHKYFSLYLDKISFDQKAEFKSVIEDINKEIESNRTSSIPFIRYSEKLKESGAIRIDQETTFDSNWKQQIVLQQLIDDESDVLNVAIAWPNPSTRDLCEVAYELLKCLLDLYVNYQGQWGIITRTLEYKDFVNKTAELQRLSLYANEPGQLTFWINIFNCLALHIHSIIGPPTTQLMKKLFIGGFKYKIGSHTYSLSDIRSILRGNPYDKHGQRHFQKGDYRKALSLRVFDCRIHFAISVLKHSSPDITLYNPKTIDEDLQKAGELFLRKHAKVDVDRSEITLPTLFSHYMSDFAQSENDLLIFLFPFLETRKRLDTLLLMESGKYQIVYSDYNRELKVAATTEGQARKDMKSVIYEMQSLCRLIWIETSQLSDLKQIVEATSLVKSLSEKLRTAKMPLVAKYVVPAHVKIRFLGLSDIQRTSIPLEKHETLSQLLTSVCKLLDEMIGTLSLFGTHCDNITDEKEMQDIHLFLISILKVIKSLEKNISTFNTEKQDPSEKPMNALRHAIYSEIFDIINMIKVIEEDLDYYSLQSTKDAPSVLGFAHIVRYIKKQLQAETDDSPDLKPYISKTFHVPPSGLDNKSLAKVVSLKNLAKGGIDYINNALVSILETLPNEKSPKQTLFVATKIRNVRLALRNIKGKKVRQIGRDVRLTMRILDLNNNADLQKELSYDELLALERSLDH